MVERVAVAVDGSAASLAAVAWAVTMVEPGGTVIGIDVKELVNFYLEYATEAYLGGIVTEDAMREWDAAAAALAEQLHQLGREHQVNTEWEVVTMDEGEGLPASGFIRAAAAHHAQAVVVGQHRGFRKAEELFGSFSRYVAVHSHLPTVIVPAPDPPPAAR